MVTASESTGGGGMPGGGSTGGGATAPSTGAYVGLGLAAGVGALAVGGGLFAASRREKSRPTQH